MSQILHMLAKALRPLCAVEGRNPTPIPWLSAYRCTADRFEMPDADTPYLYLVAAGTMRLFTHSGILDYEAGQYSISSIDAPLSGHVLRASDLGDFLALAMEFTLDEVISVVLEMDGDLAERIAAAQRIGPEMESADADVPEAALRLVSLSGDPDRRAYMARLLKREILFHALCGTGGQQFLQSMVRIQDAGEIYEANSWIKQNFKTPFTVEALAEQKHMSVSAFHQKFKSAVGMGPLQCQKRLRLTEAHRLMLDTGMRVTDASLEVGYESVSQFIRDYKKMFGAPPREDVHRLRRALDPPECAAASMLPQNRRGTGVRCAPRAEGCASPGGVAK